MEQRKYDTDEYSAHKHQEVINPLPDVVLVQSADPGFLERVVESSLGNVSSCGVEQQEGDAHPLPINIEIIKLKTLAQQVSHCPFLSLLIERLKSVKSVLKNFHSKIKTLWLYNRCSYTVEVRGLHTPLPKTFKQFSSNNS